MRSMADQILVSQAFKSVLFYPKPSLVMATAILMTKDCMYASAYENTFLP